jgi:hypothetical protein
MRDPENATFFLLFQALQLYPSIVKQGDRLTAAIDVVAALLDRVFETANLDEAAGKASVSPEFDSARKLAVALLPEMETRHGNRYIIFSGERFHEEMTECLRQAGGWFSHEPAMFLFTNHERSLTWSSVLAKMSSANSDKALQYFRHANDLRSVFTRHVMPSRQGKKFTKNNRW